MSWLPWLLAPLLVLLLAYLSALRPPQVTLSRELPAQAFAGQRGTLKVQVTVHSRWPLRVYLQDPAPAGLVAEVTPDFGGLVLGRAAFSLETPITFNRRGVYGWPEPTLRWSDAFGLFGHRRSLAAPTRVEVYPGFHGLRLPDLLRPLLSEGALSRTLGLEDPISLRGARPYVAGDPPGRIGWRLSARTGGLMVRELERTAASSLALHLDENGDRQYLESAVRLAASLIHEAGALDLPLSVSTSRGAATPTGRTPESLRLALRRLAEAQPQPGQPVQIPIPRAGSNLIVLAQHASPQLVEAVIRARTGAARALLVLMPEGFYLEPGENPRPLHGAPPDDVRALERIQSALHDAGVLLMLLRGNQSVLRLGA